MIGTTLQHYRIVRALGSGGMGEVYAAEDLRLHRLVALKVLPQEMAVDAERLARFRREAQAVAALNHPNVVTIHGVEEADGVHFLTMELVEGKTLSALIPADGCSLPGFLKIAVPLADAVSAAHQRGIVHRDLKPANVMVGPEGRVKVLDFGLAKLKPDIQRTSDAATATGRELTSQHHIIGTAAYMSPEQAEGQPVDARSDIFSLGVLFYEMATGVRPFRGTTPMSVMSSIIKDSPVAPIEVNPSVPRDLDRIIRRCLAKNAGRRYQTAVDLRNDLEELQQPSLSEVPVEVQPRDAGWGRRPMAWFAGAAIVAAGVYAVLSWTRAPEPPATLRAEFTQLTSLPGVEWFPSLSPDGRWLVYAAAGAGGNHHIYLQSVTGQTPLDLTKDSTADDDQPAFSPDGERIAFRSSRDGGGIFVMGRTGEAVRRVTRIGFKPAWSPDGSHLAFTTENVDVNPWNSQGASELWTVNVSTGDARLLNEGDAVLASWSPHDHRIAFTRRLGEAAQRGGIWTIPAAGGTPKRVTSERHRDWNPAWSSDGRYLYFGSDRGGSMNLWRVRIDEASGEALAEPEPVTTPAPFLAHPSISADGTRIVYTSAFVTANIQRMAFDPVAGAVKGEPAWLTTGSRRWSMPDASPDGEWVAFYSLTQPEGHVYIARPDGGGLRQVTGDAADRMPRWSSDGKWIAAFSDRSGRLELWKIRPDGSDLQQLTEAGASYFAWSPDGSRMATAAMPVGNERTTWIFDPNSPWKAQTPDPLPPPEGLGGLFTPTSWSPDGERLVGQVDRTGRGIAIATYTFRSRRYERLADFGEWPQWLPDSRRVLFVANGDAFYVIDTRTKELLKIYSSAGDVIGPPRLTPDGKMAYFSRRVTESDIWLVTLK